MFSEAFSIQNGILKILKHKILDVYGSGRLPYASWIEYIIFKGFIYGATLYMIDELVSALLHRRESFSSLQLISNTTFNIRPRPTLISLLINSAAPASLLGCETAKSEPPNF